jgi:hypothetical protein
MAVQPARQSNQVRSTHFTRPRKSTKSRETREAASGAQQEQKKLHHEENGERIGAQRH